MMLTLWVIKIFGGLSHHPDEVAAVVFLEAAAPEDPTLVVEHGTGLQRFAQRVVDAVFGRGGRARRGNAGGARGGAGRAGGTRRRQRRRPRWPASSVPPNAPPATIPPPPCSVTGTMTGWHERG